MFKNVLLISLLNFIIFIEVSSAQSYVDLFNINYYYSPNNDLNNGDHIPDEVTIENISTSLRIPLKRKNGDIILLGAAQNQLNFHILASQSYRTEFNYYGAGLQLGYQKNRGDSSSLLFMVLPKFAGDKFEYSDNGQLGGILLYSKVRSARMKWKYGVYMNMENFGFFIVPLIGFDWKASNKLRFFGNLPAAMTGEYTFGGRYRSGLKFTAPAASYVNYTGGYYQDNKEYLHQYVNQLSWFQDIYITNSIVLNTRVGYTAFRYYRLYDAKERFDVSISGIGIGGSREPVDHAVFDKFGDGLVFEIGLIYRYELEKRK